MKKTTLIMVLVFCVALLTACNTEPVETNRGGNVNNTFPDNDSSHQFSENNAPKESEKESYWLPEYNYETNELVMKDILSDKGSKSYAFENPQNPLLVQKIDNGIVMISSQSEAEIQSVGGITIITGETDADALTFWLFNNSMEIENTYELTDKDLVEGLQGYRISVSPDGKEIVYASGDKLYSYSLKTQKLEQLKISMDESVYYGSIKHGASGDYLAFYGSIADADGTAYGSIDLTRKVGKAFFAKGFSATTLAVNGEYAAIAHTLLPNSMGGGDVSGSVLFLDIDKQEGKAVSVNTGAESWLAAVSHDGKYIVTCDGGDGPSGVLRVYQVSNNEKVAEQEYTMNENCKPNQIFIQDSSAYAVLSTENGTMISPAVNMP